MSPSRSSIERLLSALATISLPPHVRAAANAVEYGDAQLTIAEATGRHATIVRLVRERKLEDARFAADQLHRDAMLAIDRLPLGSAEAIAIAGLALKSVEVL